MMDEDDKAAAEERFKSIQEAYDVRASPRVANQPSPAEPCRVPKR